MKCRELIDKHINNNSKIIESVQIKSKILSIHIYSKYYIDATGESNFCEFLNCNFIDDKEKTQPSSLRFIVSNIDLEKFYLAEVFFTNRFFPVRYGI